jgi:hypothetical protein
MGLSTTTPLINESRFEHLKGSLLVDGQPVSKEIAERVKTVFQKTLKISAFRSNPDLYLILGSEMQMHEYSKENDPTVYGAVKRVYEAYANKQQPEQADLDKSSTPDAYSRLCLHTVFIEKGITE